MAGEGRGLEPELGGGSLDDSRDIAGCEAPIRDALRTLVDDTTEDSALGDTGCLESRLKRSHGACDLAPGDAYLAAEPLLISFTAPDDDQRPLGGPFNVL